MSISWNMKYRAKDFESYIGNTNLKGQLKTLVSKGKLPQTLMFIGSPGTGKTSLARLLTKTLMCQNQDNGEACGECQICQLLNEEYIQSGRTVHGVPVYDYNITNMNTVEDANQIIELMRTGASMGQVRVFILDEIQEASKRAQNAFLKVTEEPMPNTYIIMCTTHPQNIVPAIKSRFHIFNVMKPSIEELVDRIAYICQEEGVNYEKRALKLLSSKLKRVPRDCINRAETLSNLGDITRTSVENSLGLMDFNLYIKFINNVKGGILSDAKEVLDEFKDKGVSIKQFINGFGEFLIDVVNVRSMVTVDEYTELELREIKRVIRGLTDEELQNMLMITSKYTMTMVDLTEVNYFAYVGELGRMNKKEVEVGEDVAHKEFNKKTKQLKEENKSKVEVGEMSAKDIRRMFGSKKIER